MKPLIAIHSCSADIENGRHNAIRETWYYEATKHADVLFFVGREALEKDYNLIGDEICLDATEDKNNLVDKEQMIMHWATYQGYERILKTETDVYFNVRRLFDMDYERADVIGRYIGQWGDRYRSWTNLYSFIQGHACWYSAKAARIVADNLRQTYDALRPTATFKEGELDPGLRAADLWIAQLLTPYWHDKTITVDIENGFAYGPRSWHLQGNCETKARTPEWMRQMHKEYHGT